MNVKILYDNEAKKGFRSGWGFAALVDDTLLFDMGEEADSLLANMQAFGVMPEQIENVVLSHDDWDHVGGLAVLKHCRRINVYVPAGVSRVLKKDITCLNANASVFEVLHDTTLGANTFATATLGRRKKETSLAVRTPRGLVLLCGCAHPGLEKIIEHVRESGNVHAVIGGFHGFSNLEALAPIPRIIPCHCTQKKQEILALYPGQSCPVAAGVEIQVAGRP